MLTSCSCGEPHPHTIATRRSFDNIRVDLDSDGTLWIGSQRSSTSGAAGSGPTPASTVPGGSAGS